MRMGARYNWDMKAKDEMKLDPWEATQ